MEKIEHLYSRRCWFENSLQPVTVSFKNGIITSVVPGKATGAIDLGNDILMPGVIDAHVHINEPGRTHWEGFTTATLAAAAGGITTLVDMPLNASPVTTSKFALDEKLKAAKGQLYVNVGFYGGLVPDNIGKMEELVNAGVLGVKCFLVHSGIDEFPNVGEKEIDQAMPILAKYGVPLLAHCEIYEEASTNHLSKFPSSYSAYLASRPKKWENDAVALMIKMCRKHNCPTHIVHVSSAEALDMIAEAKKEGLPLTAETCPHYLLFHAGEIADGDTVLKCAPPIRDAENNLLLKQALESGVLDFVSSDHSPAPAEIKQIEAGNFQEGWGGIAGLQFLLQASWTALKDHLSIEKFIPLVTENPARFLKLGSRKGTIRKGFDADFVAWNPEERQRINADNVFHRHKISPYISQDLFGTVKRTYVTGRLQYEGSTTVEALPAGSALLASRDYPV